MIPVSSQITPATAVPPPPIHATIHTCTYRSPCLSYAAVHTAHAYCPCTQQPSQSPRQPQCTAAAGAGPARQRRNLPSDLQLLICRSRRGSVRSRCLFRRRCCRCRTHADDGNMYEWDVWDVWDVWLRTPVHRCIREEHKSDRIDRWWWRAPPIQADFGPGPLYALSWAHVGSTGEGKVWCLSRLSVCGLDSDIELARCCPATPASPDSPGIPGRLRNSGCHRRTQQLTNLTSLTG